MNKGFILTITTLYYVALFIFFLSLVVYVSFRTANFGSESIINIKHNYKFVQGDTSLIAPYDEYWCSNYSPYDANLDLGTQTQIVYKKYCEDYNGKRVI